MPHDRSTPHRALSGLAALAVLFSLVAPLLALTEVSETWHCHAPLDEGRRTLVILDHDWNKGRVLQPGVEPQPAHFEVRGLGRNWYFPDRPIGHWPFRFLIEPNGRGSYFDFSRSTEEPVAMYQCLLEP